jgi:hypothetical protein
MSKVYDEILDVVCDYFGTTPKEVFTEISTTRRPPNIARVVATYLIREYTGDKFWCIGHYFNDIRPSGHANSRHSRVKKRMSMQNPKMLNFQYKVLEIDSRVKKVLKKNLDISYTPSTLAT